MSGIFSMGKKKGGGEQAPPTGPTSPEASEGGYMYGPDTEPDGTGEQTQPGQTTTQEPGQQQPAQTPPSRDPTAGSGPSYGVCGAGLLPGYGNLVQEWQQPGALGRRQSSSSGGGQTSSGIRSQFLRLSSSDRQSPPLLGTATDHHHPFCCFLMVSICVLMSFAISWIYRRWLLLREMERMLHLAGEEAFLMEEKVVDVDVQWGRGFFGRDDGVSH